jgi:hypothetical protein
MNTTAHAVTAEEIMAFLDGELSAPDAQIVAAHLDTCAECSRVAGQFRKASQELKCWTAPGPALSWDSFVLRAAGAASGGSIHSANAQIRAKSWTWKQWALAGGGTAALLLLVLAFSMPNLLRSRQALLRQKVAFQDELQLPMEGSAGKANLSRDGQPITDQQSKTLSNLVTLSTPGIASDSSGLFHGLGDHAEHSFGAADALPAPMIARTVSLSIVVKDFPASRASLDLILARHRGYSAQLNVSTPENAPRGVQASLRIPVAELPVAVTELKTLGRVENESQSGEEVTQQHSDLLARLKTSRDTEERFGTILQQRSGNVSEVLQVEEGIARVRGDIERMEAEQKALEHRVDFATVELQLSEVYKAQLNSPAASVSTRLHNSTVAGVQSAWETLFGILLFLAEYGLTLLIWLAILAFPTFLVWRRYKRKLAAV